LTARGRALSGAILLLGAVGAQILARRFPAQVESAYARRLYPNVAAALGALSSGISFSVAECLVAVTGGLLATLVVLLVFRLLRDRTGLRRLASGIVANGLFAGGLGYAFFLVAWGFNYSREPFASNAGLVVTPVAVAEVEALAGFLVAQANEQREGLPENEEGALRIEGGFASVSSRVEAGYEMVARSFPWLSGFASRPKPVLLSPLLSRLGISGIFSPFTGEPNVNTTLPDAEQPYSAAHEVAHQRGIAREDEANYVAYLACVRHPDRDFRYSGWSNAAQYTLAALYRADPAAHARAFASWSPAARRDLLALKAWSDRYRGRATDVGRRVNDAYLKAQGQADGVRSYGRMVDLLLAERRKEARANGDAAP